MDLQMPEMDGIEATRRLRSPGAISSRPRIVAVTANVMQSDRDMCIAAGMDEFIGKPMNIESLVAVLVRAGSAMGIAADQVSSKSTTKGAAESAASAVEQLQINHEALDKLRVLVDGDGEDAFSRLIHEHLQNAAALLTAIHVSILSKNIEEVRRAAHSLKSSSAMFGATGVSIRAAELEAAAKQGDMALMRELARLLENDCKITHGALLNVH
jgi:CheY-like chemotaxis protein